MDVRGVDVNGNRRRRWVLVLAFGATLASACDCTGTDLDPLRPSLELVPSALEFEPLYVGAAAEQALELQNTGGASLAIASVSVAGEGFALVGGQPSSPLAAGASVEVTVRFSPTAAGPVEGSLVVVSNSDGIPEAIGPLTGSGLEPLACDASTPCELIAFDPQTGVCVSQMLEGECEDASACTTHSICIDGQCVGDVLDCGEPPVPCQVGLCDAELGCTFVPVDELCDDDDPCTADTCTETGCASTPEPEGAPCGPFSCAEWSLCIAGTCQASAPPEGIACSDDDACTTGDMCTAGGCVGTPVGEPGPQVLGSVFTFGGESSQGLVLGDGRVVVRDSNPFGTGAVWTVLERFPGDHANGLGLQSQTYETDAAANPVTLVAVAQLGLFLLEGDGSVRLYLVEDDGVVLEAESAPTLLSGTPRRFPAATVGGSDAAVVCLPADAEVDPRLRVLSAAVPPPFVLHEYDVPAPCQDLDGDLSDGTVWVSFGNGGATFGVQRISPLSGFEDPVTRELDIEAHAVSAEGGLVSTARRQDDFLADDVVEIWDAESLALLSSFEVPVGGGVAAGVEALHLESDTLFVLTSNNLRIFDVADPANPSSEPQTWSDDGSIHPHNIFSSNASTVVRTGSGRSSELFRVIDVAGPEPYRVVHSHQGTMLQLEQGSAGLYALSRRGVHLLSTADPGQPAIVTGMEVDQHQTALWGLGQGGGLPRYPVEYRRHGTFTGWQPLTMLDGSGGVAQSLGLAHDPFLNGVSSVASDGSSAWAFRITTDAESFIDAVDLGDMVPGVDDGHPLPQGQVSLGWAGADRNTWKHIELTEAPGGLHRGAVAMQHDWDFDTPAAEYRTEVGLFLASPPGTPTLVTHGTIEGLHRYARAAPGPDGVVLTVGKPEIWFGLDVDGDVIHRLVPQGDELVIDATVEVGGAGEIVWIDDERAIAAAQGGAMFLRHGPGYVEEVATVALPDPPTDAFEVGELIWLVGATSVTAIRPPCDG